MAEGRHLSARHAAYIALGWICVTLGVVGIALPVLPTTPFLLVAAWAFAKSSRRFHDWLVHHPRLGPPVRAWREHGVVPTRAKIAAVTTMIASLSYVALVVAEDWRLPAAAALPMAITALWLLTRPGRAPETP